MISRYSELLVNFYLRAIARNLWTPGDPGGVSVVLKYDSSLIGSGCTVIVCRKSSGNDIWPGSFFNNWKI